jgi:hypothetical protein
MLPIRGAPIGGRRETRLAALLVLPNVTAAHLATTKQRFITNLSRLFR